MNEIIPRSLVVGFMTILILFIFGYEGAQYAFVIRTAVGFVIGLLAYEFVKRAWSKKK